MGSLAVVHGLFRSNCEQQKKDVFNSPQQNSLDALELKISAYMHKASIIKSVIFFKPQLSGFHSI